MGFIGQDTIVFIRKDGSHYHIKGCWMIEKDYYGIEFKDINKKQYKPCGCVLEAKYMEKYNNKNKEK
jgi:hypothetical protein